MDPYQDRIYDWLAVDEVEAAAVIERQGYPPDEAASLDTFRYRQTQAKNLFLGVYLPRGDSSSSQRELIGYICSTLSPSHSLTHDSMSTHIPTGSSVCLHSLCISPPHRKKGLGSDLLREYLSRLRGRNQPTERSEASSCYERVLLLSHAELRLFYEKAGFEYVGQSPVALGSRPWFEMQLNLASTQPTGSEVSPGEVEPLLPQGLLDQLQLRHPTRGNKPPPRLLSSFPGGLPDVLVPSQQQDDPPTNKFDLVCPRAECRSVILNHGVGQLIERASVQMEPPEYTSNPLLPALPAPPATTAWWLVTPSPMTFENIGFSRPVHSAAPGKTFKLLSCAECDLGPLGWTEGEPEFWLACGRVGYRVQ